ncbi:MAG: GAF domain-containing sensor histidine kinase [Hydrococcus sp. C42_A2020_068]|uniref:sensor histidine kinase n=1 Tax=Pleurocapsa sp. PCC 7327 TaxID=118163 RepID=UPI00029FF4EE|nr:GAF domain-containing sensor histidine kinase [Pleurocapsa sp. PCC 7327]AFY76849.1 signal transduction histidine kinase [Pleurocapsa sp. PCC 7327]MBF2020864.1 GAF domain-containing sensor histidine kinase [Hydrococcus sp. C42_A2020_068]
MSRSRPLFIPPSSEFIALCQSQIALLTKGLKADWSAVYLAEEILGSADTHLIPIAIYPQTDSVWKSEACLSILPEVWNRVTASVPLLLGSSVDEISQSHRETEIDTSKALWEVFYPEGQHQMVFPLMDEDRVMGLLVTGRKKRQWKENELGQIEQIAKTIALACLLDRRQSWYQQQLSQQYRIRRLEKDRLDSLLHQLRNPLTALRTFGKLLLKRLLPEDRNQSVVQGILRESDRLRELLQEFEADIDATADDTNAVTLETNALSLPAAASVGDSPSLLLGNSLSLKATKVKDVLEPLLDSARAIAQEKDIHLSADLCATLPPVQANSKALREVLSNLIDNALKYTPAGGTVHIATGLERADGTGNWQGIAVCDTGYGIPLEDREHLFERHYRGVQAQGEIPGTGLGLAIVRELVEQMHGKIDLISPNEMSQNPALPGTTFIVWLLVAAAR